MNKLDNANVVATTLVYTVINVIMVIMDIQLVFVSIIVFDRFIEEQLD